MPTVRRIQSPNGASDTASPRIAQKPTSAIHTEVEKRLWDAADQLRANSKLELDRVLLLEHMIRLAKANVYRHLAQQS